VLPGVLAKPEAIDDPFGQCLIKVNSRYCWSIVWFLALIGLLVVKEGQTIN